MPLRLTCPCGKRLRAAESLIGKVGRCPACGQRLLIRAPKAGVRLAAPASAPGLPVPPAAPSPPVEAMRPAPLAPADPGVAIVDRQPMWHRPISATLGRINAPLTALVLGTTAPFKPGPCRRDHAVRDVAEGFVRANSDDRLELQLGSSMPLRNLSRIWKRRGLSVVGKVLGTLFWPQLEAMKALSRMDCYDAFAHSVALYHNDPAILAHELGHAEDFARRQWRTLYLLGRIIPIVMLYQEWKASRYGIRNLQGRGLDADIKRANRVMGGGFGSYVGGITGIAGVFGLIIGALLGQLIGALAKPFGKPAPKPPAAAPGAGG